MKVSFILAILFLLCFVAFSEEPQKKSFQDTSLKDFSIDLDILLAPYNYSAENRRDPFVRKNTEELLIEDGATLTEAQQYTLRSFKVLGIIWNHCSNKSRECRALSEKSRVMLADPKNKIHYLSRGDRIGNRGAYIEEIREGEIVVIEPFRKGGKLYYRSRILAFDDSSKKSFVGGE